MLQVTIEAMLDICSHVISRQGWGLPKTHIEAVEPAASHGLIPQEREATYKAMASFRNRVVHLYDEIDTGEIWDIIQNRLEDFKPFMASVVEKYLSQE